MGRAEHRKMFVIDGHVRWFGGAGFEDQFHNGGWLDTYVWVAGVIVRQLQAVFCTTFHAYGGDLSGELSTYFPEPDNRGDIRVTLLQTFPGGFLPGTRASQATIGNAHQQVDVLNP